jgi:GNAT superfamily N-acetyltransferase
MNVDTRELEKILREDPIWSAYALADLEPEHEPFCTWMLDDHALLLIYRRLEPTVLYMQGEPASLAALLPEVPVGTYQFSCLPEHKLLIDQFFQDVSFQDMWRMVFTGAHVKPEVGGLQLKGLGEDALMDIERLIADHQDAPDAFIPEQLSSGVFYGVYDRSRLVALSGTHVCSTRYNLAAVGNVFTDPDYRGNGFAAMTTQAVIHDLSSEGIETIVLNVAQANTPAIKTYERIGFRTHCAHLEGHGILIKR